MKVTYDAEVDVLRILLSNAPIKPSRIPRSRSRLTASVGMRALSIPLVAGIPSFWRCTCPRIPPA